jgi:hypothetical protein
VVITIKNESGEGLQTSTSAPRAETRSGVSEYASGASEDCRENTVSDTGWTARPTPYRCCGLRSGAWPYG